MLNQNHLEVGKRYYLQGSTVYDKGDINSYFTVTYRSPDTLFIRIDGAEEDIVLRGPSSEFMRAIVTKTKEDMDSCYKINDAIRSFPGLASTMQDYVCNTGDMSVLDDLIALYNKMGVNVDV